MTAREHSVRLVPMTTPGILLIIAAFAISITGIALFPVVSAGAMTVILFCAAIASAHYQGVL